MHFGCLASAGNTIYGILIVPVFSLLIRYIFMSLIEKLYSSDATICAAGIWQDLDGTL